VNHPGPVLITGAGGGIGLATALEAARRGWRVVASVHSVDGVEGVRQAARDSGLTIDVEVLDVLDERACEALVDRVRPYALVNNAGLGGAGAIEDTSIDAGRRYLDVMAVAPMRLSKLALPHMRRSGGGRIVNVSSLGGRTSSALTGWYTASKHALESLSDALRMEVASDGVFVSLVEPGGVDTGILEKSVDMATRHADSRFVDGYRRAERLTSLTHYFRGDAQKVARSILKALERPRPRARYVVGVDARLLLLAGRLTPLRVRDHIKRRLLAL
jgi:NAD(P)-dependent dehydrogenase (short-subunit alcohol dehydrogenase family)